MVSQVRLKIAIAIGIAIAIDRGIGRGRHDSDSDPVWANELPILISMRGDNKPIAMIVYCFFGILHLAVYTSVIPGMAAVFLAAMTRNPQFGATSWIPAFAGMT